MIYAIKMKIYILIKLLFEIICILKNKITIFAELKTTT